MNSIGLNVGSGSTGFNISLDEVSGPKGADKPEEKNLVVTISSGQGGVGGTEAIAIKLSYPMIGLEDFPLTEFLQQLDGLDLEQFSMMSLTSVVLALNDTLESVAKDIQVGGKAFVEANREALTELFGSIEEQSGKASSSLYEMLSSGKYPDFNDFLKLMLETSQTLRQLASEAKQASIQGQFENIMMQAAQMIETANKNYDAAMKEVDALKSEAIGSIVSGSLTLLAIAVGGKAGGMAGAQFGGTIGGAAGQIIDGSFKLKSAGYKADAAADRQAAELSGAIGKKLEATLKLTQQNEQIADELRDIAKTLRDMVLKLYQDFNSAQNQIIQRSNI